MGIRRKADPKIEWLASQPWWCDLSKGDLRNLAATGDRATVEAGTWFMRQGERGREAAVIISGEVEIVRDDEVIARVGPGEVVGELSLLGDYPPRGAGVRAATDTELLVFDITAFRNVMHEVEPVREQVMAAAERHTD
jgi:CRP-like cAMP-binding protein